MSYNSKLEQTGRKVASARRKYYGSFDYGSGTDVKLKGGTFSFSRKHAWGGPDGKTWIPEIDETEVDEPDVQAMIAKYFRRHPNDAWNFGKDPETGLDYGAGFEGMSSGGTDWGGLATLGLGIVGDGVQGYNSMNNRRDLLSQKYDTFGTSSLNGLTDNNALLSAMANTQMLSGATAKDFRNKSVGQDALSVIGAGVSGAKYGGIYGALAGIALKGLQIGGERWNAKTLAENATMEAKRKNRQFLRDMSTAAQDVDAINDWRIQMGYHNNPFEYAYGGPLHSNGGDYNGKLTYINAGGTHEQNPNEGVLSGFGEDGVPNLVEEGEVIWDNSYVFSDRLHVPKPLVEKYKLGGKKDKPITFADAISDLTFENSLSPNDPITIDTTKEIVNEFMDAQEQVRAKEQESAARELEAAQNEDFLERLLATQGGTPQGGPINLQLPAQGQEGLPVGFAVGGDKGIPKHPSVPYDIYIPDDTNNPRSIAGRTRQFADVLASYKPLMQAVGDIPGYYKYSVPGREVLDKAYQPYNESAREHTRLMLLRQAAEAEKLLNNTKALGGYKFDGGGWRDYFTTRVENGETIYTSPDGIDFYSEAGAKKHYDLNGDTWIVPSTLVYGSSPDSELPAGITAVYNKGYNGRRGSIHHYETSDGLNMGTNLNKAIAHQTKINQDSPYTEGVGSAPVQSQIGTTRYSGPLTVPMDPDVRRLGHDKYWGIGFDFDNYADAAKRAAKVRKDTEEAIRRAEENGKQKRAEKGTKEFRDRLASQLVEPVTRNGRFLGYRVIGQKTIYGTREGALAHVPEKAVETAAQAAPAVSEAPIDTASTVQTPQVPQTRISVGDSIYVSTPNGVVPEESLNPVSASTGSTTAPPPLGLHPRITTYSVPLDDGTGKSKTVYRVQANDGTVLDSDFYSIALRNALRYDSEAQGSNTGNTTAPAVQPQGSSATTRSSVAMPSPSPSSSEAGSATPSTRRAPAAASSSRKPNEAEAIESNPYYKRLIEDVDKLSDDDKKKFIDSINESLPDGKKVKSYSEWKRKATDKQMGSVHSATMSIAQQSYGREQSALTQTYNVPRLGPTTVTGPNGGGIVGRTPLPAPSSRSTFAQSRPDEESGAYMENPWERMLPIYGTTAMAINSMLNSPDYSNADAIIAAARQVGTPVNIPIETIGDYMPRRVADARYLVNVANQNRLAAARGIANTAAGNRSMDLLGNMSLAHSNQQELAEIDRQRFLAQLESDLRTGEYNRGTNIQNMGAINQRNLAQAQLNSQRQNSMLSGLAHGYGLRQSIWTDYRNDRDANIETALDNWGLYGREKAIDNQVLSYLRESGNPFTYNRDTGEITFLPEPKKRGGKLNRKKRRF